ncbi:hypothetical protein K443DRAFT_275329 [Laccaria amethystina LaAM-08-1]|uniref:Uncharacterized protein n=1 Tax=Laccaria amethystina LaAM-08-1 TaxID=1095629 RepID=A0A0C9X5W9_9AGAR|nr:hypothetical protein K443DRAFT_275329 [Laccaria amethystina LaAM-08-1]
MRIPSVMTNGLIPPSVKNCLSWRTVYSSDERFIPLSIHNISSSHEESFIPWYLVAVFAGWCSLDGLNWSFFDGIGWHLL